LIIFDILLICFSNYNILTVGIAENSDVIRQLALVLATVLVCGSQAQVRRGKAPCVKREDDIIYGVC